MSRAPTHARSDYRLARVIPTRWMDNDVYGHVNNVVYYSWFDTAVNTFLIERGLLDPRSGTIIGLVVESGCRYNKAVTFPEAVTAMIRVGHLGTSSVRYEIGLFAGDEKIAAAQGHFVHVYVDRHSRRPVTIPDAWREVLSALR
ncbi:MAG: hypothetical protein RL671_1264 [Pseudomonadota bacterium]|jgi:acyl-CoA thioester hydrolase